MGQKAHPNSLRVGFFRNWNVRYFADKKTFPLRLVEDTRIREFVKANLYNSGVSQIELERPAQDRVRVTVHTAKPGMVIGKGGTGVEDLRKKLDVLTGKQVKIDIVEIKAAELDAQLMAESIAQQLEKRISTRRAMKQSIGRSMRSGAKGVRIIISGRIGGAEIARKERDQDGTVPLHTLRADIDFGIAEARTTYGKIGVKVWIHRGDLLSPEAPRPVPRDDRRPGGRGPGGDRRPGGDRGPRAPRPGGNRPSGSGGRPGPGGGRPGPGPGRYGSGGGRGPGGGPRGGGR